MKKFLGALLLLIVLPAAATFFLPGVMERSAALWLRHHANRSGVQISFDRIRAPLLRPMKIHNLKINRAGRDGSPSLEITAPVLELKFHLASALGLTKVGHAVRLLRARHLLVTLHGRAANHAAFDWNALGWLLPDEFDLGADRVLLDQPLLRVEMRNAQLNGSVAHAGTLAIASTDFRAPLFRQTFADTRGVTRWENNRLVIAGTRLRDGLTIDSITFDFTRLNNERLATEIAASIFGGNLRINLATEKGKKARLWESAASLTGISLAQLAGALGATEQITGTIRASKFTFRGDPRDFVHATASIWMELADFSWRERNADLIMLGANFYERTIQLQELYLKQRSNEFTLSGETTIGSDWLNPDFHGEIAGAINDLGQFAQLFGRSANDFRGKVAVRGHVHTYEHRVDGEIALTGDDLTIFRLPVELLTARVAINSSAVQVSQFELKRGPDLFRADGELDLARNRAFHLTATTNCREIADYNLTLPLLGKMTGPFEGTLSASGDAAQSKAKVDFTDDGLVAGAELNWRPNKITFGNLSFQKDAISTSFTGEVDLSNRHHVTAAFTTPQPLHAEIPAENCIRGLRLTGAANGPAFSKIEFDGRDVKLDGELRARLCPSAEAGAPLTLSPAPSAPALPAGASPAVLPPIPP